MSRIYLPKLRTLTLHANALTSHARRLPRIPQLTCKPGRGSGGSMAASASVGKDVCARWAPSVVRCVNAGENGGADVDWTCEADLPEHLRFGRLDVSCEGWDGPGDPYVLKGSCGLTYELVPAPAHAHAHAHGSPPYHSSYPWNWDWKGWNSWETIAERMVLGVVLACVLYAMWCVVRTVWRSFYSGTSAGNGGSGDGGGGGGSGGGGGGGGRSPPPPYTPRTDDHFKSSSHSPLSYATSARMPGTFSSSAFASSGLGASSSSSSSPSPSSSSVPPSGGRGTGTGFWSGMGLGGLGGLLAGRYLFRQEDERAAREREWARYTTGFDSRAGNAWMPYASDYGRPWGLGRFMPSGLGEGWAGWAGYGNEFGYRRDPAHAPPPPPLREDHYAYTRPSGGIFGSGLGWGRSDHNRDRGEGTSSSGTVRMRKSTGYAVSSVR